MNKIKSSLVHAENPAYPLNPVRNSFATSPGVKQSDAPNLNALVAADVSSALIVGAAQSPGTFEGMIELTFDATGNKVSHRAERGWLYRLVDDVI